MTITDYMCGNCSEEFSSINCDPDHIQCPECEAHRCPCCAEWFGGQELT